MATFQESGDAGATISEAAGVVSIPQFDKIEGSFPNSTGDVDFYEIKLETDVKVNAELSDANDPLALFDSQNNLLANGDDNRISFDGNAGDTLFLKVGRELEDDELAATVITPYEVTFDVKTDVPTDQNDTLTGGSEDEVISGLKGDDLIYGGEGKDSLKGNDGNDTIYGGEGNDILVGGKGTDILYDEAGNDVFYYSNINQSLPGNLRDSVGMDVGEDRIDLKQIDANSNASGDRSFDFIGTSRFTAGSTGQVRYDPSNNLIQVEVGGDADTIVDMEIASHKDFSSLSAEDFVL